MGGGVYRPFALEVVLDVGAERVGLAHQHVEKRALAAVQVSGHHHVAHQLGVPCAQAQTVASACHCWRPSTLPPFLPPDSLSLSQVFRTTISAASITLLPALSFHIDFPLSPPPVSSRNLAPSPPFPLPTLHPNVSLGPDGPIPIPLNFKGSHTAKLVHVHGAVGIGGNFLFDVIIVLGSYGRDDRLF